MANANIPLTMTGEQFQHLANMFVASNAETLRHTKIQSAATGIDRCDGSVPELTREWIQAISGWETEEPSPDFLLPLIKTTTTGDLLQEVRRWTTEPQAATTWPQLRAKISDHFLSACETTRLQTALESIKQKVDETPAAYIRRFKSDVRRAYPNTRESAEEQRVVMTFLKGFRDRSFAGRIFKTERTTTLEEAVAVALEKEAKREKLDQALGQHEPMEIGAADKDKEAASRVLSIIQTMERRMAQLASTVDQHESRLTAPPRGSRPQEDWGSREKPRRDRQWKTSRKQQGRERDTRQRPTGPHWTHEGEPICFSCNRVGHMSYACTSSQAKNTASGGR